MSITIEFVSSASKGYARKYPTRPNIIRFKGSWCLTVGKWWVNVSWHA